MGAQMSALPMSKADELQVNWWVNRLAAGASDSHCCLRYTKGPSIENDNRAQVFHKLRPCPRVDVKNVRCLRSRTTLVLWRCGQDTVLPLVILAALEG